MLTSLTAAFVFLFRLSPDALPSASSVFLATPGNIAFLVLSLPSCTSRICNAFLAFHFLPSSSFTPFPLQSFTFGRVLTQQADLRGLLVFA
jgi:hypothetical protein